MSHPHDDKLLELALELLDADASQAVRDHLRVCEECRARFERIERTNALLGGITPSADLPALPVRRARVHAFRPILRAAAVLLLGFVCGYGTSLLVRPEPVTVVPSYFIGTAPADSLARYPASDATQAGTVS